jgi:hypothetical protein
LQVAASVFDRLVRDDVKALQGQFVVEIGVRQAWPFLTLCDNARHRPAKPGSTSARASVPARHRRPSRMVTRTQPSPSFYSSITGPSRTLPSAQTTSFCLVFDAGHVTMTVDAAPRAFTGDIWWLAAVPT